MVKEVAGDFSGASFDGTNDLKSYHRNIYHGEVVHWGADYVFCNRDHSKALWEVAARRVAQRFGLADMPAVIERPGWGSALTQRTRRPIGHWSMGRASTV